MIAVLDPGSPGVAESIHRVHMAAYAVEQQLIGAADFPPLRLSPADIAAEPDTHLGYREANELVGVLSFVDEGERLMIGRLVVHPGHFRRGIARKLLQAVERRVPGGRTVAVSTGERNAPAIALYTTHGYALTERRELEGIAVVLLEKRFPDKRYRLLGSDGPYFSDTPGALGGNGNDRIYGRLDCRSPQRGLAGGTYQKHRVFFADEAEAIASGFRPCRSCLPERHRLWQSGGKPGSVAYPWLVLPQPGKTRSRTA